LVDEKIRVYLAHFLEFAFSVKLLQVENLVIGKLDLRDERSIDVDSVDVGLVLGGVHAGVVFLE
jgi:hypothetical protein